MDLAQLVTLSFLQGFTEFLPVSSSAHLILLPKILAWGDQGLVFDVAVHLGTLLAILLYFNRKILALIADFFASVRRKRQVGESGLAWAVIFGTIPAGIFGLLFNEVVEKYARSEILIASTTIIFGLLLYLADKKNGTKNQSQITIKIALLIGLAQAIALIPGVSRSGVTMSAALFLGFSRSSSAEFSFLLSIPIIVLAALFESIKLLEMPQNFSLTQLFLAVCLSAASAYVCIKIFMKIIQRLSFTPFVLYRLILGAVLLWAFV